MKTQQLLDAVKTRHSLPSDYALAKFLGIRQQTISGYRQKGISMDDEIALLVADKLKIDGAAVLAWMHAERAKSAAARKAFERLARLAQKSAAAIYIWGFVLSALALTQGSGGLLSTYQYILCKIPVAVKNKRKLTKNLTFDRLERNKPRYTSFALPAWPVPECRNGAQK